MHQRKNRKNNNIVHFLKFKCRVLPESTTLLAVETPLCSPSEVTGPLFYSAVDCLLADIQKKFRGLKRIDNIMKIEPLPCQDLNVIGKKPQASK